MFKFIIIISIFIIASCSIGIHSYLNLDADKITPGLATRCKFLITMLCLAILTIIMFFVLYWKG